MKITLPLVSVVIPCFNEEAYIGALLKGLSEQTYPKLEIIISDARSTDQSIAVIKQFNSLDLKIVSSDPKGPAYQRNFGAKAATGEWLLFIDADITLDDKNFVKTLVNGAIRNDWETATTKLLAKDASVSERIGTALDYYYLRLLSHTKHPVAPGWCILTKKTLFDKNKGFNEKIFFGEDYDYVSRVAKNNFGFVKDTHYLINLRRVHEDGLKFLYKCIANEVYRHTHGYNLEKSPYSYIFGKHK